jgi:hypothetical protein
MNESKQAVDDIQEDDAVRIVPEPDRLAFFASNLVDLGRDYIAQRAARDRQYNVTMSSMRKMQQLMDSTNQQLVNVWQELSWSISKQRTEIEERLAALEESVTKAMKTQAEADLADTNRLMAMFAKLQAEVTDLRQQVKAPRQESK